MCSGTSHTLATLPLGSCIHATECKAECGLSPIAFSFSLDHSVFGGSCQCIAFVVFPAPKAGNWEVATSTTIDLHSPKMPQPIPSHFPNCRCAGLL